MLKSKRLEIFRKVYLFIKSDKILYFALGGIKVWNMILSLLGPALYLILINNIMLDNRVSLLPLVIGGYIGIYLLQTLSIVLNKRFYNKLFLKFNLKIKIKMLSIYSKLDMKIYEKYNVGDLKNRLDSDIGVVEKFFNVHFLDYFYLIINVTIISIILLSMNWVLALTSFVMVPLSFGFVKVMGKRAQRVSEEQREMQGEYESFLHGTFKNWKQVNANNLEGSQSEEFQIYRGKLSKLFVKIRYIGL